MALPSGDLIRNQVGGTCAGENWLIGVWTTVQGMSAVPNQSEMDARAESVLTVFDSNVWSAPANSLLSLNATGVKLTKSICSFYRDGVSLGSGIHTITPIPGTASSATPFYVAQVVTLKTATAGRRGRGRMYPPVTNGALLTAAGGQWDSGSPGALCANFGRFLGQLAVDDTGLPGDPSFTPVVVSIMGSAAHPITLLASDTIPDTQHGRTRRITAASTGSSPIIAP